MVSESTGVLLLTIAESWRSEIQLYTFTDSLRTRLSLVPKLQKRLAQGCCEANKWTSQTLDSSLPPTDFLTCHAAAISRLLTRALVCTLPRPHAQ